MSSTNDELSLMDTNNYLMDVEKLINISEEQQKTSEENVESGENENLEKTFQLVSLGWRYLKKSELQNEKMINRLIRSTINDFKTNSSKSFPNLSYECRGSEHGMETILKINEREISLSSQTNEELERYSIEAVKLWTINSRFSDMAKSEQTLNKSSNLMKRSLDIEFDIGIIVKDYQLQKYKCHIFRCHHELDNERHLMAKEIALTMREACWKYREAFQKVNPFDQIPPFDDEKPMEKRNVIILKNNGVAFNCQYVGSIVVDDYRGMKVLNSAIGQLLDNVNEDKWPNVTLVLNNHQIRIDEYDENEEETCFYNSRASSSDFISTRTHSNEDDEFCFDKTVNDDDDDDEVNDEEEDNCLLKFDLIHLSFIGIYDINEKFCGIIYKENNSSIFRTHAFRCEDNSIKLCSAIRDACRKQFIQLSQQKNDEQNVMNKQTNFFNSFFNNFSNRFRLKN
ncbi:hypothetical protein SNEBB_005727 [Seison nebaliae]|nr:hypothetical protein SNEBB_005727 [Seison nebaliae]